jgi:flagellar motility protein MotE (MotC chaperone)
MEEKQIPEKQTPKPADNNQRKPTGIMHSIIVILLALLIVVLVFSGVFYFSVKNNIYGFADFLKPKIENHPVLKLALPSEPEEFDPDDPENLTQDELLRKYNEYRLKNKELSQKLEGANAVIRRLEAEAALKSDNESILAENQAVLKTIREEKEKLESDKKAFSELVARQDPEKFKEYYQRIDKEAAHAVYEKIIMQESINKEKSEKAKPFAEMEPVNAARVLTELYSLDKEALLDIIEGLKPGQWGLILEQMDSKTAAEIISLLSKSRQD